MPGKGLPATVVFISESSPARLANLGFYTRARKPAALQARVSLL
jgi:hypothetical protein